MTDTQPQDFTGTDLTTAELLDLLQVRRALLCTQGDLERPECADGQAPRGMEGARLGAPGLHAHLQRRPRPHRWRSEEFAVPVCGICKRERTVTDYSPLQAVTGRPLGWYSADDGEVCPEDMTKMLRGQS